MNTQLLIESINTILNLKEKYAYKKIKLKEILIALLDIYKFYLQLNDGSILIPVNTEGQISSNEVLPIVLENLEQLTVNEEKSVYGSVKLLPEDDFVDLIVSMENAIFVLNNSNETLFIEEFMFQIKHVSHLYLINCINYFSQLEGIHQ